MFRIIFVLIIYFIWKLCFPNSESISVNVLIVSVSVVIISIFLIPISCKIKEATVQNTT